MSATGVEIIDSHLHLFNLAHGQYSWLQSQEPPFWPDKSLINRNYTEQDLALTTPLKLAGFVHIEAGFDNQHPWRELKWLEQHCTLTFRSVANLDLTSRQCEGQLNKLLCHNSLVGVRHILDEQASAILARTMTKTHLHTLATQNLSFDAQLSLTDTQGVTALAAILEHLPELVVIIEHAGWPPNTGEQVVWQHWCKNLNRLAQFPNVAIKLSGWEMPNRKYSVSNIQPVLHQCLSSFGAKRVMLASNFPLCTFTRSYQQLWQLYTQELGVDVKLRQRLVYQNAANWYGF